jgi:RNA polymerase sigma-70 factor (ECF subfamily)
VEPELLLRLRERIVAYAAYRLSRDVAEDVAQEVMVVLHEKYSGVDTLEDLLPLSIQIARFKIAGLVRKSMRRGEYTQVSVDDVPLPDPDSNPGTHLERKEMLERLEAALAKLGDRCRELFRLKLQGKTFAEIQEILGAASINTVYTWDFRCRKQLLEWMGGRWEGKR